jgi:hypothetical protein
MSLAAVAVPALAISAGQRGNAAPSSPLPELRPVAHEAPARAASFVMSPRKSSLPPISPPRNQAMTMTVEVIETGEKGSWKQVEVQVVAVPEPSVSVILLPAAFFILRRRRSAR